MSATTASTKRKSVPASSIITEEDYKKALSDYAKHNTLIDKIAAARDAKIKLLNDEYDLKLAEPQKEREENFKTIQSYCIQNRGLLFKSKKSMETLFGVIGFRKNPASLKPMKGKDWKAITILVSEKLPTYIRTISEPNKELLLADRDKEGMKEKLEECSIAVKEEECFYIDLKQTKDAIK